MGARVLFTYSDLDGGCRELEVGDIVALNTHYESTWNVISSSSGCAGIRYDEMYALGIELDDMLLFRGGLDAQECPGSSNDIVWVSSVVRR
jgi:hypothetical protein